LLDDFFNNKTNNPILWNDTYKELYVAATMGTGIDLSTVKYNTPEFDLITNLVKDAGRFSAYKDNQFKNDLQQLANSSATIDDFKSKARPLIKTYKNYLDVEKANAIGSSQMAKKWQGFEKNADIYPNLRYRAVMDSHTRADHAQLNGVILPITDPFWNTHYPPNGYGCRCSVTQTDKPATASVPAYSPPAGFDFNAGKDKRLFSETAGYYKNGNNQTVDATATNLLNNASLKFGLNQINKVFKAPELGKVAVTEAGFNDALNRPYTDFFEKNAALANVNGLLNDKSLTWFEKLYHGTDPDVKIQHYAEITLNNKKAFLVVNELTNGEKHFYGIVEY